jgi:peptidoglycan/LPS O-acetylase OafA/YrhL
MGAFRLILAIFVAISHMGITIAGINPGIFSVVSFLLISGLVMTALINKNYSSTHRIPAFYLDRAIRLYPQFLFYFIASCVVIGIFLSNSPIAAALNSKNIIPSLAIAPLGLYMFGVTTPDIIPPAWSLGLEVFFYLTIPFLLLYKIRPLTFIISLTIFIVACLGWIDTDIYGYRLLPGVLFIFLCGSYMLTKERIGLYLTGAAWLISLVIFSGICLQIIPRIPNNIEVSSGIVFGVPAVYMLSKFGYHRIDEFFGNISYGVFLNHFLFIYLFRHFGVTDFYNSSAHALALLATSFAASLISYKVIEEPALKLRHAIRKRGTLNKVDTTDRAHTL